MKAKKFILGIAAFMITAGLSCVSVCAEEADASDGASAPAVSQTADGASDASGASDAADAGDSSSDASGTDGSGETTSDGAGESLSDGEGSKETDAAAGGEVSGETVNDSGSDVSDVVEDNTDNADVTGDNVPAETVTDDAPADTDVDNTADKETESDKTDAETEEDGTKPAEETADAVNEEVTEETDKSETEKSEEETESDVNEDVTEKQESETGQEEKPEEESFAAAIADTMYETVEQAFSSAADGDTVYVLKDAELTDTLYVNADIEVLADENVRITGNGTLFSVAADTKLTIGENVTLYSANTSEDDPMVALGANAVLDISGGTLSASAVSGAAEGSTVVLGAGAAVNGDIEVGSYDGAAATLDVSDYAGDVSVSVDAEGTYDGTVMLIMGGAQDNVSVSTAGYTVAETDGGLAINEIAVDPTVTVELVYDSELDDPGVYEDVASGWHMTITAGNKAIETIDPYVDGESITAGNPLQLETKIAQGSQFVVGIVLERASSEVDSFGAMLDGDMYDAERIGRGADADSAVEGDDEEVIDSENADEAEAADEAETANESEEDVNEEV